MKPPVVPDKQTVRSDDKVEIRYGTPLWRLNDIVENQPQDQESTDFLVGDIRDVCNAAGTKEKIAEELREHVKGKNVGASVSLPIASVKSLIACVLRAAK